MTGNGTRQKLTIGRRRALARKYGVEMNGQPHRIGCSYCGHEGTVTWYPPNTARRWLDEPIKTVSWVRFSGIEIDHCRPVAGGGTNDLDNLVLCCAHCNVSKSNRTMGEWLALLASGRSRHPRQKAVLDRFTEVRNGTH